MTLETGLIFGAIACILGVLGYAGGMKSAAKTDGQEWGAFQAELRIDVKHIKEDISEVKAQNKIISDQYSAMHTDVEIVKRDLKTAFSKIDDVKLNGK